MTASPLDGGEKGRQVAAAGGYGAAVPDLPGFTVRPCTPGDAATVLALVRADEERASGQPSRLVEGSVRDWWQVVDLANDSWLLTRAGADAPVAAGWLEPAGDAVVAPLVGGEPEVVRALVDLAEQRATAKGARRLQHAVLLPHPVAEELLAGRGYRDVRHFYEMAVELDGPPPAPVLPPGLTLQPFTPDDARAFHAAIGEAFTDHWEFHPLPFDEWWQMRSSDPDVDFSWWFLVRDRDEVAAAMRNVPGRGGGVYVGTLGVRRPWRGRGLAKALLAHTFARAWEAGFRRVTLGVDASSPTGATALYRSVGMTVEQESALWETTLA